MLPWMSRAVRISVQFVVMALRRMITGLLGVNPRLRSSAALVGFALTTVQGARALPLRSRDSGKYPQT
jgi:hypothetical protein